MNSTTKNTDFYRSLFGLSTFSISILGGITFLGSAIALPNPPLPYSSVSDNSQVRNIRSYCQQAVKPSPGANYNAYRNCLVDRDVTTLNPVYWQQEVRRHCENAYYPFGIGKSDCYLERGVRPSY